VLAVNHLPRLRHIRGKSMPTTKDPSKRNRGSEPPDQVSTEAVQAELERVLASRAFASAPRLSRLLKFIVEQTLQGNKDRIKEYALGVDVFDRGNSYDSRIDPIVRVEAGRLRTKLLQYYQTEGEQAPLVLELPKGTYVPSFRRNTSFSTPDEEVFLRWRWLGLGLVLTTLLLIASFMFYRIKHSTSSRSPALHSGRMAETSTESTPGRSWQGIRSIAVLPFEDLSPNKDQAYFCDGMTETVIDTLTKLEGLRVAARTSSSLLSDKQLDIETIGAKLHVGAILEGSVRREGKRLRVTARVVNVSDGLNLWSETYDRNSDDVFAIQDEISWGIAEALESKLVAAIETHKVLPKAIDCNPEAYSLYLRGRYHLGGTTRAEIEKGIGYFEKAIKHDPNCALAYSGIAEAYDELGNSNLVPPRAVMPKAKAAALRALAIDNSLAEAHAALGLVESTYDWNWRGAEQEFKRAIALDSRYASAYRWYGLTCLASTGRMVEALAAIKQAQDLDPLSLSTSTNLATILMRLGQYNEAIQIFRETLDLDPKFFWAHRDLGVAFNRNHMFKESVQTLEEAKSISNQDPAVLAALGYCYAAAGEAGRAQSILNELTGLMRERYVPPYHIAALYTGLGDKNKALEWLGRAYEDRSSWMNGIKVDPLFTTLHAEPRFVSILQKMGLQD